MITTTIGLVLAIASASGGQTEARGGAAPCDTPATTVAEARTMDSTRQQPAATFDVTRFDSATAVSLRSLLDAAAARGLPTAPLVNKALEGSARRASSSKILEVVRSYVASMAEARDLLGVESTATEVYAGADALRAGVDPRVLVALRETRPPGSADIALMVITDIVKRGVPSMTARDAVNSIARMPRSDDVLLGLQQTVAKNALRGPTMAVDALTRYVRSTVSGSNSPSAPAAVDRKPIRPPTP